MANCHKCGAHIPKGTGTEYQIDVATGRSGGSWSFGTRRGKGGRTVLSPRYYTGRTYYKKVWVTECDECCAKSHKQNMGCLAWTVIVLIFVSISMCSGPSENAPRTIEHVQHEQSTPRPNETAQIAEKPPAWEEHAREVIRELDETEKQDEK